MFSNMTEIRSHILPLLTLLLLIGSAMSCNSKKEEETEVYSPSSSTAVTAFKLKANSEIMARLDSVFFSIDLDRGLIFNADSLPKGTSVNALGITVSTPSGTSAVTLTYSDEQGVETVVNYLNNSTAKIDFRKPVRLSVTAQDGITTREYIVKVNVHQSDPDLFAWSETSVATLPSRMGNPRAQKSFRLDDTIFDIIEESDGSYTLAETSDLPSFSWQKRSLTLPFTPNLASLQAGEEGIFILSDSGELYTSADAVNWQATGLRWESIIGPYMNGVLGIRMEGEGRVHTCWPEGMVDELPVSQNFPISGASGPGLIKSQWSQLPTLIIAGGKSVSGEITPEVWGFDGSSWSVISANTPTAAVSGAMLIPYWTTKPTGSGWQQTDQNIWLLVGGTLADGSPNSRIWYSPDNGVNWRDGGDNMSLPAGIPGIGTDAVVWIKRLSVSATAWQSRLNTSLEGSTILWDCPEIYFFGGTETPGAPLSDTVWRGVLTRFTFVPLI